jgi:hypothetical protein
MLFITLQEIKKDAESTKKSMKAVYRAINNLKKTLQF